MTPDDAHPATTSDRAIPGNAAYETGATVVLSGLFYLYIWLCVGPHLLYQQQCPIFLTTVDFFKSFIGRPGGVVGYVSAFLTQFCYYPWLGALGITVVAGLVCLATRGVLRAAGERPVHQAAYLFPLVLLAMLHGRYKYQPITSVAVLAALALANVYVRTGRRSAWVRLAAFTVLSAAAYYIAGGAYVVFAASCGVFELVRKRAILLGVVCLVCAPVVPYGFAMYSYDVSLTQAWMPLQPFRRDVVFSISLMLNPSAALYVLLLAYAPLATLWMGLVRKPFDKLRAWSFSRGPAALRRWLTSRWSALRRHASPAEATTRPLLFSGAFLIIASLLTFAAFDTGLKTQILIDYHAEHRRWPQVLETARRLPPERYDLFVVHEVNRALYHTDGLLRRMFSYPQTRSAPSISLTREQLSPLGHRKFIELCFEMGHVNVVQHYAHSILEAEGHCPTLLKLLTRVNVLKGRPQAARTFLGALAKHLVFRHWAEDYRKRLDTDPITAGDEEIRRVRPLLLTEDVGYGGFGSFRYLEMLHQLLRTNPRNRMAFEYLIAHHLLAGNLEQVVFHLRYLDNFKYPGIPRHYEEAVVLYMRTNGNPRPDLKGQRVSSDTLQRWETFARDLRWYRRSGGRDRQAALETLIRNWGGTYFFFYTFGFSEPRPGWKIRRPDVVTGATE
ncbi:MAG: hypothetical protein AMS16_02700 [Planctomycetes bacterium DG_58]|nr:MAG: hypothetical protein AMS16_02700 [Planctomycetes bacterium DG_58]